MQHDLQKHFRDGRMPVISVSRFINEEHSQNYAFFPHMHRDYLELFYVYHGNGRYMVGGKTYSITEGDIVICNAGVLHSKSCEHAKNLRSYSIGITNLALHLLPDNWLCSSDTMPILSCGSLSRPVGEIFRLVYLLSSDQQHLADICNCLAAALVLLTHELLQSRDKHKPLPEENETSVTAERIRQYLDEHFREALTLPDIGKALNISEYYLAHIFKDAFDSPPMQYVMKRRIGEAQNLLSDTDMSITDITYHLGFSSVSHFTSSFIRYVGTSPGKYRQSINHMDD